MQDDSGAAQPWGSPLDDLDSIERQVKRPQAGALLQAANLPDIAVTQLKRDDRAQVLLLADRELQVVSERGRFQLVTAGTWVQPASDRELHARITCLQVLLGDPTCGPDSYSAR